MSSSRVHRSFAAKSATGSNGSLVAYQIQHFGALNLSSVGFGSGALSCRQVPCRGRLGHAYARDREVEQNVEVRANFGPALGRIGAQRGRHRADADRADPETWRAQRRQLRIFVPVGVNLEQRVLAMCVGLAVLRALARGPLAGHDQPVVAAIDAKPLRVVELWSARCPRN